MIERTTSAAVPTSLQAELRERISREEMPAYIYTYPPKSAYRPFTDGGRATASWRGLAGPLNLYVHIPFCEMRCSFCNLFATTGGTPDRQESYLRALRRELELVLAGGLDRDAVEVRSLYFGGGTPTSLANGQLAELLTFFRERLRIAADAEIAIEGAPNSLDEARCAELRTLGFTRLSLGVQSFDDGELARMGRHHTGEQARRMVAAALAAGLPNVNLDLIYGFEDQSHEGWRRNLETALALAPTTITIYPLVIRRRTGYGRRFQLHPERFAGAAERYAWYDLATGMLAADGYAQHTLVTFARPGGGCGHEADEFRGVPTLGLGAGARSYAPTLHYTNDDYRQPRSPQATLNDYVEELLAGGPLPVRSAAVLDGEEQARRGFILPLLFEGVDRAAYRARFGVEAEELFGPLLAPLWLEGCLAEQGGRLCLTPRGRRFSSLVAEILASPGVAGQRSAYA
jgi:oxygen-independent coproporphyrinogen-3 oxidase